MTTSKLEGEYRPPVPYRVIFGQGKVSQLQGELEALGGRRALLLSGPTVAEKTDSVQRVRQTGAVIYRVLSRSPGLSFLWALTALSPALPRAYRETMW